MNLETNELLPGVKYRISLIPRIVLSFGGWKSPRVYGGGAGWRGRMKPTQKQRIMVVQNAQKAGSLAS